MSKALFAEECQSFLDNFVAGSGGLTITSRRTIWRTTARPCRPVITTLGGTIAAVHSKCQSLHNYEFATHTPKRVQAARDLANKVSAEIKHVYLTSGDSDIVLFIDAPSGDNVAKLR